ncbi:Thioredoxin reductase gliT [Hondaea fermentalgiana]|uniref:Thioredoxin reductase gliT n=1 Tax=Hondaea fermentalgiana TaxID=2315210 RepID=A0A2R5G493_9STRA|nr:Thioredoxin reductase gliT [Hondaea fermentalgiana]|eukprot:GBG25375.1 Thioredoxin reductase gliT [Hondaea fermentalgiana]
MASSFEVAVVGAGSSGLSAALTLGRSLRKTVVLDNGTYNNHAAATSNGFLTRDNVPPPALREAGLKDLERYETVEVRKASLEAVQPKDDDSGFVLQLADGSSLEAAKIIFATGARDVLPEIDGLEALWGKRAFHCVYCDGYEVRNEPIGFVMGKGMPPPVAAMFIAQTANWSDKLTVFADGLEVDDGTQALFKASGYEFYPSPISSMSEDGDGVAVKTETGDEIKLKGVFVASSSEPACKSILEDLGCEVTADPMSGSFVKVDDQQKTSVPGVFACGDVQTPFHTVGIAAAAGFKAAAFVNFELCVGKMFKIKAEAGLA